MDLILSLDQIVKKALIMIVTFLLVGCAYTPKLVTVYDEECKIEVKQMELEEKNIMLLSACTNEGCIASILGAGLLSAGSVIVSGSIVVTANVVYWLEKKSQC